MMLQKKPPDFQIRLPDEKDHLKKEIKKIAKKNRMSMNELFVRIIEWFLDERKKREFTITLK